MANLSVMIGTRRDPPIAAGPVPRQVSDFRSDSRFALLAPARFDQAQTAKRVLLLPALARIWLVPAAVAAYLSPMEHSKSPFDEGVVAAETGMSRDDNPYKPGTAAHSDWNGGYDSAVEAGEATELDHEWRGEPS